ncbi:hypothetical protein DMC25_07750 [Caulobacter sp. D4A]|uniref:hypothetical protein n=1 Tax=unclassified Caulobacter TaxID=2648921 RepID=UPI000D72AFD0|nr:MULTISPECIES: hypothetical protein [unclassified Caulobacter]PXA90454.1 hypothetical protein DMC25_07750 [Caulobacter sp. D4A]PXA96941.1 hypothetical protein DMC18_00100 [Caulobacter sp. D5]
MEGFRIRPLAEADIERVVLAAGGRRAHLDADARELRGADFVLGDVVIELKALDEEGFEKPDRQRKLAALFAQHESGRPVIVVDRERLPETDQRAYDRIVEGPIKSAIKSARGQLAQSRIEIGETRHSVVMLVNNGYTALDHDELLALAERRARNDSSEIDGVIVAGCYFHSDGFDANFFWPMHYIPIRSQAVPTVFEALHAAWDILAEEAMTELVIKGHGALAHKGPVVDLAFEVDEVTFVKPSPPMGRKSDFFVRGRPRSDSSGLTHCPPVAQTYPRLSLADWTRMRKLLHQAPGLCDSFEAWLKQEQTAAEAAVPLQPFVTVPVTAAAWKAWAKAELRSANFTTLTTYAALQFELRARKLLAAAVEQTVSALRPTRYILALTEEIGQDRANDVSHLAVIDETDGGFRVEPILEDVRMFHEYALVLACAYAQARSVEAVLWRKDQTYGWV